MIGDHFILKKNVLSVLCVCVQCAGCHLALVQCAGCHLALVQCVVYTIFLQCYPQVKIDFKSNPVCSVDTYFFFFKFLSTEFVGYVPTPNKLIDRNASFNSLSACVSNNKHEDHLLLL